MHDFNSIFSPVNDESVFPVFEEKNPVGKKNSQVESFFWLWINWLFDK